MININKLKGELTNPVVTVGTFDGVHLGHQKIMRKLVTRAGEISGNSVVVTYHPHPLEILKDEHYPYLLSEKEKKEDFLKNLGIDYVLWLDFNKKMANMPAPDFVKDCFVNKLHAKEIIVGYDWHFGRNQEGDYHLLRKLQAKYNFQVDVVKEVLIKGNIVSSTKIREYLNEGKVEAANSMLGRNYSILGRIKDIWKNRDNAYYEAEFIKNEFRKLLPKTGIYSANINKHDESLKVLLQVVKNGKKESDNMEIFFSHDLTIPESPAEIFVKNNLDLDINKLDKKIVQNLLHKQN